MLIVGAGGFAKECIELAISEQINTFFLYDDINLTKEIYGFGVFNSIEEYIRIEGKTKFILGVGNPKAREKLYNKMCDAGMIPTNLISSTSMIGKFDMNFERGICIMQNSVLTTSIEIKKGVLINLNCTIGHDVSIDEFTELSPNVNISGGVKIGKKCFIGTSATILPNISIGNNVTIGAGAVITNDLPDNCLAVGVPATIKKYY